MRLTWIAVLGVGVLAGGCMKQDSGGLMQREAKAAGDALGNGLENAAATYGPMTSGAGVDATCISLTGDTSDPDGDSIPTDARLTYDCTAQALGFTGTLTGTMTAVDDQPSALAWAFTGTADMHASLTGPAGGSITSDWSGDIIGSQASAVGPYALERTLGVTTTFETGGDSGSRLTTVVTEDNDWAVTFTPQATWTPGGLVVTGSLAAQGTWNVAVGDNNLAATLATTTPLTVDPACATLLTAGVVTGSYPTESGGTGTITVTWTGCGLRTVTHAE